MNTLRSLAVLAAVCCAEAYPTWPSVATWKGNVGQTLNQSEPFVMYYDISGDLPRWSVAAGDGSHLELVVGTTMYTITHSPMVSACQKQEIPTFPYPKNQFENATLVSTTDFVDHVPVNSWVATSPEKYAVTFATEKDVNNTMKRMVTIDVPTEFGTKETSIFEYGAVTYEVPKGALDVPSFC